MDGFQYHQSQLQFFPTSEGYVRATLLKKGTTTYSYVFNYTDHLGNIRLSYGLDPATNLVKIMEDNHYYPFGLKHTNYNSDQLIHLRTPEDNVALEMSPLGFDFPIPTDTAILLAYNYKFQGQERQDELGLGWDSFKYRNYDFAIGRFMNIDPLTEKYNTWSPYVFSGNRVVDSRELEGLEPVDFRKDDSYKNLVVINMGYDGKNRAAGQTQSTETNGLASITGGGNLSVVRYASSQTDSTKMICLEQ